MPEPPDDQNAGPPRLLPDDFRVAEALEALHTEIVEIEAFAHAAGEAVTRLPHTSDPELRRAFTRIYTLVSKVAADLTACARHGDELIAAVSEHLQRRDPARPPPDQALEEPLQPG